MTILIHKTPITIISDFPKSLGRVEAEASEYMYYLYYPIKVPGEEYVVRGVPENLKWLIPMLTKVKSDAVENGKWNDHYVYVTCKNMYVEPGTYGNRPGWHGDGFGTDDINYLWCSDSPTEFAVQTYETVNDDRQSLHDFETLTKEENVVPGQTMELYRIDQSNIHRVAKNEKGGVRCFVKISLSKHKFNLKGNSINPNISANWIFYSREELRNMENKNNGDFV